MKLVVCGDSHSVALARGLVELGDEARSLFPGPVTALKLFSCPQTLQPFFEVKDGGIDLQGAGMRDNFRELTGGVLLQPDAETVYALSLGFTTKALYRHACWSTSAPYNAPSPRGKTLISQAAMDEILRDHYQHQLAFLNACRALGVKFLVVGSPGPRLDDKVMRRAEHREVRRFVDQLARDYVARELDAQSIPYVLAPEETFTEPHRGGYLRDEYCSRTPNDFYHANGVYGAIMMRRVAQRARDLFAV